MKFYLLAPIVLAACSVMRPLDVTPRPAVGLPERFIVDSTFKPIPPENRSECAVHLLDARDQTKLTLQWSAVRGEGPTKRTIGDYRVEPAGRYGVGAKELLRVWCGPDQPDGIVPE